MRFPIQCNFVPKRLKGKKMLNVNGNNYNNQTQSESIVDKAILEIREYIKTEEDSYKKHQETGIDLLVSLCQKTAQIKKSNTAKKELKERANEIIKRVTKNGKQPVCNSLFLKLFYVCFYRDNNESVTSNAFSQKKMTYYNAYLYCDRKYGNEDSSFSNLKEKLQDDGITSVRKLYELYSKEYSDRNKENRTKYPTFTHKDKLFSIHSKLFKKVVDEDKEFFEIFEENGFEITVQVSKKSYEKAAS